MKFFVSYSRSIKNEVAAIIKLLSAAGHEVWWDDDIPTIADWWATILENIEGSEIMLFMVSEKSVQSPYCMEEMRYGIKLNRPVLPFIMDDHIRYTLPPEFGRRQWYIYDGDPANMLGQINQDCGKIKWEQYVRRAAPRPPEPNSGGETLAKQFQEAVSLAEAGKLSEASYRFTSVSSVDFTEWGKDCQRWIMRIQLYRDIADLADHKSTLYRAKIKWDNLIVADPEAADFDPLLVSAKLKALPQTLTDPVANIVIPISTSPTSTSLHSVEIPQHTISIETLSSQTPQIILPVPRLIQSVLLRKKSADILPFPFTWITVIDKGYSIAKYPVTNAQFATFIDAGGYNDHKYWTDKGWEAREKGLYHVVYAGRDFSKTSGEVWTQPRYWTNIEWNVTEQPVVGVSWYESIAFCLWLSEVSGEEITLPTEDQWQYAAEGDDRREFPWGAQWSVTYCNNNVDGTGVGKTTEVRQYEGTGDSPFGVVDMAGNIWEWCLTDYSNKTNDINNNANKRVIRGGSWHDINLDSFRCNYRGGVNPYDRGNLIGFRICRS